MELIEKILVAIKRNPKDMQTYDDAFTCMSGMGEDGLKYNLILRNAIKSEYVKAIKSKDYATSGGLYDKLRESYVFSSGYSFEDFIFALEYDRENGRQFYSPRQMCLSVVAEQMQALADGKLDLLCVSLPPGTGKSLVNDTPIMTDKGWKNHGDLEVGDKVVGLDGKYKNVTHVHPKCANDMRVHFSNHTYIDCHENHEWVVSDRRKDKKKYENIETKTLLKNGVDNGVVGRGHTYYYQLPVNEPIVGCKQDLCVDPYVLGVWLGDGTNRHPILTICDTDKVIVDDISKKYEVSTTINQVGCTRYSFKKLRSDLQLLGMCKSKEATQKHIPMEYKIAPIEDRLNLLAGLIDTDGTLARKGRYSISTSDEFLKNDICELISTFGWRFSVTEHEPCLSSGGIEGKKINYRINFNVYMEVPCRVKRKQSNDFGIQRRISITKIEKIEPKEGNCITVDGGIYLAGKSMLPTHNTTLAIFFILWLIGRHPELPILSGSHSTALMRGVYEECHRIATDPEYNFAKIFPNSPVVRTNAQDLALDFKTKNRFSSLQFTSIGSGNAGRLRAMQLLYCDDLVSGIEEAMSKERLDKLWQNYTVDLKQRKMGSCPELHIATRWSVHDVIGRLERDNENNERAKFLVLPALDENEESNFDYKYSVGFSTKNYYDLRDAMDDVSWKALFMNQPIEREGLLYNAEELRRYYKLPQEEPDAIIGLADTKDTGKDYAVLMVAYVYGNDFYIEDIVCTNSTDLYEGFFADILIRNNVHMCRFESNSAGGKIADNVARIIDGKCKTRIDKKYTTGNKETKIVVNAPFVKNNFLFKDRSVIVKKSQYAKFMELFCSYSLMGKNSFDDTVDCAAMLAVYSESIQGRQITMFQRRI